MIRKTSIAALLCATFAFGACDSPGENPARSAQLQKDGEGNAWRGLLQGLSATEDEATKVRLLERFIQNNPDHPDVIEAKRRLDDLTNSPDSEAKDLMKKVVQQALEEGQPRALFAVVLSQAVERRSDRHEREELTTPIDVPTPSGISKLDKSLFEHPLVVRGHVRRALNKHAEEQLGKRCGRTCINEALGTFLGKAVGGDIYVEDGKLNRDAVGPLLEQTWVGPEEELLGINGKSWYAAFAPTAQAYIKVGKLVNSKDPAAAAKQLGGLTDSKEVREFYDKYAQDNDVANATGLEAGDARAIAGWWLRRHADGTADLFWAQAKKVVEGYDPELITL